jgi:RES domain-containing protein
LSPPAVRFQETTHRLIPSRYPATGILELIASPADFDAVAELEGWTNDRISHELGVLHIIPAAEWVVGRPGASIIMAAYCHPHPDGGRFNQSDRGAWYAAPNLDTAIRETVFHRSKEVAESGVFDTFVQMREYLADFDTSFHDVRAKPEYDPHHDPDSYAAGQALSAELLSNGSNGVLYRSVRDPGANCAVCYRPPLILNVRQGNHYEYRWTGGRDPTITKLASVP